LIGFIGTAKAMPCYKATLNRVFPQLVQPYRLQVQKILALAAEGCFWAISNLPSGAEAHVDLAALTARLKSCPFKTPFALPDDLHAIALWELDVLLIGRNFFRRAVFQLVTAPATPRLTK
jgi:hypothetical protein